MNSTRRLFVSERAWSQLAEHFALALSDRDSTELSFVQSDIDAWCVTLRDFDNNIRACEDDVQIQLMFIVNEIRRRLETDGRYGVSLSFCYTDSSTRCAGTIFQQGVKVKVKN